MTDSVQVILRLATYVLLFALLINFYADVTRQCRQERITLIYQAFILLEQIALCWIQDHKLVTFIHF